MSSPKVATSAAESGLRSGFSVSLNAADSNPTAALAEMGNAHARHVTFLTKATAVMSSINALAETPTIPDDVRGQIRKIYDGLNSKLKGMEPMDMVQCAAEAGNYMRWATNAISRCYEIIQGAFDELTAISSKYTALSGSINGLISEAKTKAVEGHVLKSAHEAAVEAARKAGFEEAQARFELRGRRLGEVSKNGFPQPGVAILDLADPEWTSALGRATARGTDLKALGLSLNGTCGSLVWASDAEFAAAVAAVKEAKAPAAASGAATARYSTTGAAIPEPAAGSGGATPEPKRILV